MTSNSQPLISVIIPTYNASNTIRACLESVFNQTYTNIETVIIDDKSTDDTNEIVKRFTTEKITHIIKETNTGPADSRNIGITNCTGELIQFLDSDDTLYLDKLELQSKHIKDLDIIFSDCKYELDGIVIDSTKNRGFYEKEISTERLLEQNLFPIHGPLIRKSFLEKVGPFSVEVAHEDWEFWIRFFKNRPRAKYLAGDLCTYVRRRESRSFDRIENLKNQIDCLKYVRHMTDPTNHIHNEIIEKTTDGIYLKIALKLFKQGQRTDGNAFLKKMKRRKTILENLDILILRSDSLSKLNAYFIGPRKLFKHVKRRINS